MEIAQQPPIVHTAYNPVVLKLTDSSATSQSITINAGTPITMQRYPLNNSVLFEISTILKNLFTDTITTTDYPNIQIDHNLFVDYTLTAGSQKLIAEKTSIMTGSDLKTIGATWTIDKTGVTVTAYFGDDGEIYFLVTDPSPYIDSNNKVKIKAYIVSLTDTIGVTGNTVEFDPYKAGNTLMTGEDDLLKTVSATWTADKTGVTTSLAFAAIDYTADGTSAVASTDKLILSVNDSSVTNDTNSSQISSISYENSYTSNDWPTNFSRDIQFNSTSNNYFTASGNTITAVKKGTLKINISAFGPTILFENDYTITTEGDDAEEDASDPVTIYSKSGTITIGSQSITLLTDSSDNEVDFYTAIDDDVKTVSFNVEAGDTISFSYTLHAQALRSSGGWVFNCKLTEPSANYAVDFTDESGATFYFKVKDISGTLLTQTDALHKTAIATDGNYPFSLDFENLFGTITSQTLRLEVYKLNTDNTQQLAAHTTCYYVQDTTFTDTTTRTYNGRPFYNLTSVTQFTICSAPSAENSIQYYGTSLSQTIQFTISEYNADTAVEVATATVVYIYDPTFVSTTTRTYNGRPFYTINTTFSGINAVAQLAESSDLTSSRGSFLTRLDRLLLYPGYPRQISCLGFKNGAYVNLSGIPLNPDAETPITPTLFNILLTDGNDYVALSNQYPGHYLQANTGEIITTNQRGEIITIALPATGYTEHRLTIENTCTPLSPYYVRWINRQGGYDYWMFSFRQTIKEKIKITDTYTPVVYDQSTASAFSRTLGVEGTATITVGASGLTDNEYQAVSKIIYSPRVQYFDTDKSTWIALTISDSDVEKDSYAPTQEIEITFQLPTPQVQF